MTHDQTGGISRRDFAAHAGAAPAGIATDGTREGGRARFSNAAIPMSFN